MALKLVILGQRRCRHLKRAIARQRSFIIDADGACNNLALLFAPGLFLLTATALKEQAMSRKSYPLSKQLVVATALALGASGVAWADADSMSRFGGDSYTYFNQPVPRNTAASPTWRQSHPNGLTERELQDLSASDLSAS